MQATMIDKEFSTWTRNPSFKQGTVFSEHQMFFQKKNK